MFSVHAFHTSSRGALNVRVMTSSVAVEVSVPLLPAGILLLLCLSCFEIVIETVEVAPHLSTPAIEGVVFGTFAEMKSLGFCLLLGTVACATGGHPINGDIDVLMSRYNGAVPGASLLVVHDGKSVVRRSWGFADLEEHVAATPATNYRLASVTKQFTAAAILLLAQDGKLLLSDRASKYLPSLPKSAQSITIHQLLTHTSGLVDYEDLMDDTATRQVHDRDVLELVSHKDSLYFPPGTSYRYSNTGYSLLSLIVEKISGKGFATFLHDRIFAPLGMNNTVAHQDGIDEITNRAYGYTLKNNVWTRKDQSTTSAVLGDGGIYSSIDDMAKWDAAQYDSRLLDEEWRRVAFTPHTPTNVPGTSYGFGWEITGDTIWHTGSTSGFRNAIIRIPSRKLTVVILTNRDGPEPKETALAVAKLFQ
jgi:CubicO group peptidase (beta-lactamase class C family)